MEVLQIILFGLGAIAYLTTSFLAVSAYFYLRRQHEYIQKMKMSLEKILMISISDHVRDNFSELNELQKTYAELIQREQYEEAKELKSFIQEAEESALKSLRNFQDIFGVDVCKIIVTKKDVKSHEEE